MDQSAQSVHRIGAAHAGKADAVADLSSPLLKRLLPGAAVGEEVLCDQLTLPHSRAVRQQRMRKLGLSQAPLPRARALHSIQEGFYKWLV